ncbi:alpha/beta fold hydrolase [uncultured Tateyamaria sp.]|uniref:alpha/beta fold hydrolase n=1 Tax=uncultured Tateyamaria sp. TaxID=455651 RepID=UPI002620D998|nr:alpha/beta fold hydrolase [uncultured Tateyamaria sp.]
MIPHIHRRTFGSGPRTVLAIHCSLAHSGAWRGLGAALGDLATLHAFDLPCHGQSGDWDGQGIMHDAATDMALSVLADIGDGPVDVIGHSFGATVALRLAIEHPEKLRTLVMYEPVYFAPVMADDPEFRPNYIRDTAPFDAALDAGDRMGAARAFNAIWGNAAGWEGIPQVTRDYMAARIDFIRASSPFLIDDCANLLAPGRFDAARMPALLLRGAQSRWAGPVSHAIARRLPNAREVSLSGVGHMAPITHPRIVAAPLHDMLACS